MNKETITDIVFTRSTVANMLFCTALTIRNREKSGVYPEAVRDAENNYRIYTLDDVFNMMVVTYNEIYLKPVIVEFWNKGFRDANQVWAHIITARDEFLASHPEIKLKQVEQKESNAK